MKKLILSLTLTAFALVPALQAGDAKSCDAKTACCAEKTKAASGDSCCAKKLARKSDATAKGATLLVLR